MKKWMLTLLAGCMSFAFIAGVARGQPGRDMLEIRAQRINSLGSRVGTRESIRVVSSQTGVPRGRLQSLHNRFPWSGPAGLTIASTLATNSRRSPDQFLNRRADGRSWAEMARNNNVSIGTINMQLDRLERSLSTLTPTGRGRGPGGPWPRTPMMTPGWR